MSIDPTDYITEDIIAAEAAVAAARDRLQAVQHQYMRHETGATDVHKAHAELAAALDQLARARRLAR